jgi:8-oxo-dGTP diphosphatase
MNRPRQADGRVHGVIVGCPHSNSPGDGRWLLIRRGEKVIAPGKVCFPGGAVEPDEDRQRAAAREMKEELGIDVTLTGSVWQHVFDDRPLTLWGYLATEVAGELKPDPYEVAEVLWLSPDEVRTHPDAMPMTELFVAALVEAMEKTAGM